MYLFWIYAAGFICLLCLVVVSAVLYFRHIYVNGRIFKGKPAPLWMLFFQYFSGTLLFFPPGYALVFKLIEGYEVFINYQMLP